MRQYLKLLITYYTKFLPSTKNEDERTKEVLYWYLYGENGKLNDN